MSDSPLITRAKPVSDWPANRLVRAEKVIADLSIYVNQLEDLLPNYVEAARIICDFSMNILGKEHHPRKKKKRRKKK